jgi:hypothetical protein
MIKTVAIVHYNTPLLTEAAIRSLRKHGGEDYKVVILDNSDKKPFTKKMKGVKVLNNRNGQLFDFDKELDKFPDKNPRHAACNNWGSVRHILSVQYLWSVCREGFLLMESDVLIRKSIDFMFREDQCCVGHIQDPQPGNIFKIGRLVPMLCWINVPLCEQGGAKYYDPNRCWQLYPEETDKRNWYDTGASFLEDIRTLKPQCHGKAIDIRPLIYHYQSGSWQHNNEQKQKQWLVIHKDLWV